MLISVIVCTRNRANRIAECLGSIQKSIKNASIQDCEIIVVDNASEDNTNVIVKEWAHASQVPTHLLFEPQKGLSRARNLAMSKAKGEVLIFIDDDCMMTLSYIKEALRHNSEDNIPIFRGGRVMLGDLNDLPLTITINPTPHPTSCSLKMRSASRENLANFIFGCNMMIRRSTASQIGNFDENLGPGTTLPAGEDYDYIIRAYLADVMIESVPDMVVLHYHGRKSVTEGKRLLKNYMAGSGAMYLKYAFIDFNICRQLFWDIKAVAKELISGKNDFLPNIRFSNKDKVLYSMFGMLKYLRIILIR